MCDANTAPEQHRGAASLFLLFTHFRHFLLLLLCVTLTELSRFRDDAWIVCVHYLMRTAESLVILRQYILSSCTHQGW